MAFDASEIDKIRKQFEREGIVCIRMGSNRNIHTLSKSLSLYRDIRVSSRKSLCLDDNKPFAQMMHTVLSSVYENVMGYALFTGGFPMEYREYQPRSEGMDWHRDLKMYHPAQVEMVYTVFNNDQQTCFEWKDLGGTTHTLRPEAGDLVMVRPNGPMHRVTALGDGTRSIVKVIGVTKNARALPRMHNELFLCREPQHNSALTQEDLKDCIIT